MQNLTETPYRELIPGFSKPVMTVKTLSVSRWWGWMYLQSCPLASHMMISSTGKARGNKNGLWDHCQGGRPQFDGLGKPASRLKKLLSEHSSQYTSGLLKKTRQCSADKSVSRNKDSGPAFNKVCTISKCFHRSSLNRNFWISQKLRSKNMLKP